MVSNFAERPGSPSPRRSYSYLGERLRFASILKALKQRKKENCFPKFINVEAYDCHSK